MGLRIVVPFFVNLKRLAFIALLTILFQFHLVAQTERRFQIWNKNEVAVQPWKNIVVNVNEKIHYTPKQNTLDLKYGEVFLYHNPLQWVDYGLGFRVSYSNIYAGWLQENRTMAVVEFKTRCKIVALKLSNRFEYRNYKVDLDHFRYRQQITGTFPSLTDWGMQFFVLEETYHKLNSDGFHLARLSGGLNGIQKEHFRAKVYYAFEKYKLLKSWYTSDIVGANLSFIF